MIRRATKWRHGPVKATCAGSRCLIMFHVLTLRSDCDTDGWPAGQGDADQSWKEWWTMTTSIGSCESCGDDGEPLTEVRRVYVTPASWETEGKVEPAAGTERWCEVCLSHYAHQSIDES